MNIVQRSLIAWHAGRAPAARVVVAFVLCLPGARAHPSDGRFPFHCHLLSHEDKGMMATVEVTAPASPRAGSTTTGVRARVNQ
jgi:hypothetical protein